MTVWVVHPVKDDLSAALCYGDIRYVNSRYVTADELTADGQIPNGLRSSLFRAARDFGDDDYLLLVGDHLQLVQFASMLSAEVGEFSVLRYDRQAKGYFAVKITT